MLPARIMDQLLVPNSPSKHVIEEREMRKNINVRGYLLGILFASFKFVCDEVTGKHFSMTRSLIHYVFIAAGKH